MALKVGKKKLKSKHERHVHINAIQHNSVKRKFLTLRFVIHCHFNIPVLGFVFVSFMVHVIAEQS